MGKNNLPFGQRKGKKNPCQSAPKAPDVTMTFRAREAETHLRFDAKIKWTEVEEDQDGFPVKIDIYEIAYVATDSGGVPLEVEDEKTRFRIRRKAPVSHVGITAATAAAGVGTFTTAREHGFAAGDNITVEDMVPTGYNGDWVVASAPDITTFTATLASTPADATDFGRALDADDTLHVITERLPNPRTWYWKARGRAKNNLGCWSPWSAWTTPTLPWTGSNPEPPTPINVDLDFGIDPNARHGRLYAFTTWTEVTDWDVPGGDNEPDMAQYAVQLQRSTDGVHKVGKTRTRYKNAKGDETDGDDEVVVYWGAIRRRNYYRTRVRSIDRFNRRGDWSAWTAWENYSGEGTLDASLQPTGVTLDVDQHKFGCYWTLPKEIGGNIPKAAVDHVEVEVRTAAAGGGTLLHSDYFVRGEHRVFRTSKPGNSTYYLRVRSVSEAEGVTAWVETSASKRRPTTPATPSVVHAATGAKRNRFVADVNVTPVADTDAAIDYYDVQFVDKEGGSSPTSSTPRDHKRVQADGTNQELTVRFRSIRKGFYTFARVRAVDTQGRKSDWSSWGGGAAMSVTDTVLTPTSLSVTALKRKLVCSTPAPTDEKTVEWRWVLSGGTSATKVTRQPNTVFHVAKTAQDAAHSVSVYARDDMGNESGARTVTGSIPNPAAEVYDEDDLAADLTQSSGKTWTVEGDLAVIGNVTLGGAAGSSGGFRTAVSGARISMNRADGADKLMFWDAGGDRINFTIENNAVRVLKVGTGDFFLIIDVGMAGINLEKRSSAPGAPADGIVLYCKDDSGTAKLYYKRSNGVEVGPL